jgi:leucyl-tRNA synthetase
MPVDQIQFGRDTIPFLLTMRLFTMFLHDRGLLGCSEFARETLAHGLILKDNKKMSKHLGNVVDPMRSTETYGADSLRFCVLAKSEPQSDYSWSEGSIVKYNALLQLFLTDVDARASATNDPTAAEETDPRSRKYAAIFLTKVLREVEILESSVERGRFDIYARAVVRLLTALHLYRTRYCGSAGSRARAAWARCVEQSVVYLAPIAPHLAEECWERLGGRGSVFEGTRWPSEGTAELRRLLDTARGEGSGEARRRGRSDIEAHRGARAGAERGAAGSLEGRVELGACRALRSPEP